MLLWLADISVGLLGSLLITGDIYYAEREADGALKRWSLPNKALTGALAMTSMALIVRTFLRI